MAALDGYAAAIEVLTLRDLPHLQRTEPRQMFDTLRSGVNQKPLRPLSLNESRDKPKEVFSYHLWHFAAGQPDDTKQPHWNRSQALDTLTWKTIPIELKKVSAPPSSYKHLTDLILADSAKLTVR